MSIFLRKIDSAVVVPVYTIWENALVVWIIRSTVANLLFNLHIAEFVGVEDFAAFHAFDVLRIFSAGDDTDSRVLAGTRHFGFLTVSRRGPLRPIVSSLGSLANRDLIKNCRLSSQINKDRLSTR